MANLTSVHHVAIPSFDISSDVNYYKINFNCNVIHHHDDWALIQFENISIALVLYDDYHTPHIAFIGAPEDCDKWETQWATHRDGVRYFYTEDETGNCVEILDSSSLS